MRACKCFHNQGVQGVIKKRGSIKLNENKDYEMNSELACKLYSSNSISSTTRIHKNKNTIDSSYTDNDKINLS